MVVPEHPVVLAVRVVLAVLESPAVPAVLENQVAPAVQVALVVPENPAVRVALVRQLLAVLARQVAVVAKPAQTRSVVISRRQAAAAAPLVAGVGALLKPRAIEVAVA